MPQGEPKSVTDERMARLKARYPELGFADVGTVLSVDAFRSENGGAPSTFSQEAMRLGQHAARTRKQQ